MLPFFKLICEISYSKVPPDALQDSSAAEYTRSSAEFPLQYSIPSNPEFEPEHSAHLLQEFKLKDINMPTPNTNINFFIRVKF